MEEPTEPAENWLEHSIIWNEKFIETENLLKK